MKQHKAVTISAHTEKGKTMTDREKLIELIDKARRYAANKCHSFMACAECSHYGEHDGNCRNAYIAESLISNGVTVQKWIPVTEWFPEDIYGKDREKIVVLVRTKSGNVSQCARMAYYENAKVSTFTDVKWVKNRQFYWSKGKKVTHWMPLPEPPKGE